MPRENRAHENQKRMSARRMHALARLDLREPTSPREAASGPTSHAVKAENPELRKMIDDALAARGMSGTSP
ncbi:hypothetical protein [Bradyrhizobium sp.]